MKIQKAELAGKLNMVKGIVPKHTTFPILQSVLISDGSMIANDTELFAKVKLDYEGEGDILIPMDTFEMINSLPEGEVEISPEGEVVFIKAKKIKNKYQLKSCANYPKPNTKSKDPSVVKVDAEKFMKSAKRVLYAVATVGNNQTMTSMCLRAKGGKLNFIGLDGHIVSWDKIDYEGEFELLIPKAAIMRMGSMNLKGEMTISHDKGNAIFSTADCEIGSRLVEGNFFDVEKIVPDLPLDTIMEKKSILEALNRARMCGDENTPVIMKFDKGTCEIRLSSTSKEYDEVLDLVTDIQQPVEICFSPRLLIESVKSIEEDNFKIALNDGKSPAILRGEGNEDYLALVLPVRTR